MTDQSVTLRHTTTSVENIILNEMVIIMLKRIAQISLVLLLSSVLFTSSASADTFEEPPAFDRSTMAVQSVAGMGVGYVLGAPGMAFTVALAHADSGGSGNAVVGTLWLSSLAASAWTAAVYVPAAVNIAGRLRGARRDYFGTHIGGATGGLAGTLGSLLLAGAIEPNWDEAPITTGTIVTIPFTVGMTLGSLVGYHLHRSFDSSVNPRGDNANKKQALQMTPTIGTPYRSDDTGWTLGGQIRF